MVLIYLFLLIMKILEQETQAVKQIVNKPTARLYASFLEATLKASILKVSNNPTGTLQVQYVKVVTFAFFFQINLANPGFSEQPA